MKKRKIRQHLIFSLTLLISILLIYVLFFSPEKHPQIKNIVLISLDNLKADSLGCYGNDRNLSPHIDYLADNGIKFENAFTPFPFTPPAHTAMMTSLNPGVFEIPLDPSVITLASVLREQGFLTAALTGGGFMSSDYGALNGFEQYDDRTYSLEELGSRTKGWLDTNYSRNFFLFLHTFHVHVPFEAPDDVLEKFADPDYSGPIENNGNSTNAFIEAANKRQIEPHEEDIQRLIDIYEAQIPELDDFIWSIVKKLESLSILNETILIITSDHGEQFYEFEYFGHSSPSNRFADVSTHIPLIVYSPVLQQKKTVHEFIELIDIPPTILDAYSIESPKHFQGKSFYPHLYRRHNFLKKRKKKVFFVHNDQLGLRTKKWKFIFSKESGSAIVIDLLNDPEESHNLYEEHKDSQLIRDFITDIFDFQNRNQVLRDRLELSSIQMEEDFPNTPLEFDQASVLLAHFDDTSYQFLEGNFPKVRQWEGEKQLLSEGKFESCLSLKENTTARFYPNSEVIGHPGALEFWFRVGKNSPIYKNIFQIQFKGPRDIISIEINHIAKARYEFTIQKKQKDNRTRMERITAPLPRENWVHVLISWKNNDLHLFVNGEIASRRFTYTPILFSQNLTQEITFQGNLCSIDELRISRSPRVKKLKTSTKKPVNPELIERLRTLGYIK
ncbi:sulfatase-like hydrolase/transferase [Acidobacteriota bacterium]